MSTAASALSTASELEAALQRGALVVDLRKPDSSEANDEGVFELVDGSLSAPWDREAKSMPLHCLPEDKSKPLVLHCRSGARVKAAGEYLSALGYSDLLNAGGPATAEPWSVFKAAGRVHAHPLGGNSIFRQLFDGPAPAGGGSSTWTYILGDRATGEAVIIDPVLEQVERDAAQLAELGLTLKYALNTHCHADHITGSGALKKCVGPGLQSAIAAAAGAKADLQLAPGDEVVWAGGQRTLRVLPTPGHTSGCVSFHDAMLGAVFTGDALLIGGCGRTDFQARPRARHDVTCALLWFAGLRLPTACAVTRARDLTRRTPTPRRRAGRLCRDAVRLGARTALLAAAVDARLPSARLQGPGALVGERGAPLQPAAHQGRR